MKKTKAKKVYILLDHLGHFMFDLVFLVCLISCMASDIVLKPSFENHAIATDVVLILLPAVITVISISLSLTKDKVFGIERSQLNKLRGPFSYSFLWMVLITILLFLAYTICYFSSWKISEICIDALAIFYALYFSLQEIPLLTQNDKAIKRVVRNYRKRNPNDGYNVGFLDNQNIFTSVIQQLIFSTGLKATYLFLKDSKKEDPNLLDRLLSTQNEYLYSLFENIEVVNNGPSKEYKGINVLDAINWGFENIIDSITFSDDFDIGAIFGKEDKIYQLTRSVFTLQRLTNYLHLSSKQKKFSNGLMFHLYSNVSSKPNAKAFSFSFITTILIYTLPEGEMWFAEEMRDFDFPSFWFSSDSFSIGFFFLIYCFYLTKRCKVISDSIKTIISDFVISPSEGLNSDGSSWIDYATKVLTLGNEGILLNSMNEMISIYESINDISYTVKEKYQGSIFSVDDDNTFSKHFLFDAWIELVLTCPYTYIKSSNLVKVLDSLPTDRKAVLAKLLGGKWVKNNTIKSIPVLSFVNYLGFTNEETSHINEEAAKAFVDFKNNFNKNDIEGKIKKNEIPDSSVPLIQSKIKNGFIAASNRLISADQSIDVSQEEEVCFSLNLNTTGINNVIDIYINQFSNYLSQIIRKAVLEKVKPQIISDSYKMSKDEINKILSFKPDYMSSNSSIKYSATGDQIKAVSQIQEISDSFMPNIFWKKGAIRTNFVYSDEHSKFRRLTSDEIGRVIDSKYTSLNGMYKFSLCSGDDVNSCLLTKEELSAQLKKYLFFSLVAFKFKVEVKVNAVFLVEKKKKTE